MKQKMQFAARLAMVLTAIVWLSACKNEQQPDIQFEQLEGQFKSETCEVNCVVAYPIGGTNETLVEAVREWINEQLSGEYTGDMNDGQAMLDHYVQAMKKELEPYAEDMDEEDELWYDDMTSTCSDSIYVRYECDDYITLMHAASIYFAGAAHGMYATIGATLRKSDGEQITWDMFKDTDSRLFQALLENGLREYFEIDDSEDLNEYLLLEFYGESDDIPLPEQAPVLTADGIEFIYQPYEVAPYSAGMPAFVVSYEHIKPFMKTSLRKLIEGEK